MSDLQLRQLENTLASDPSDFDVRQRLLASYIRSGFLQSNDLLELAALKDPGAIALTGKTPDLSSRSKRFYLRCTWVIANQQTRQLLPLILSLRVTIPDDISFIEQSVDALQVFDILMDDYLAGRATVKTERKVKFFRPDTGASLGQFSHIFSRLLDHLRHSFRNEWGNLTLRAFQELLTAYWALADATTRHVKKNTDMALHLSAIVVDLLNGVDYQYNAAQLWDMLAVELDSNALVGVAVVPGTVPAFRSQDEYYNIRAQQLLSNSRAAIIKQWLPGYTPLVS